jgi:hypothetical protein
MTAVRPAATHIPDLLVRRPQPEAVRRRRRGKWRTACVAVPRARPRMGCAGVPDHRRSPSTQRLLGNVPKQGRWPAKLS